MLQNHKPCFININNYQDISVQTGQLFAHSEPVKFWSRTGPPKLSFFKALIGTHIVPQFQLCTSCGFGIISELITFLDQKSPVFYVFLCLNSRSRDLLGSPKSSHTTHLSILISQNSRAEKKYYALARSSNYR